MYESDFNLDDVGPPALVRVLKAALAELAPQYGPFCKLNYHYGLNVVDEGVWARSYRVGKRYTAISKGV